MVNKEDVALWIKFIGLYWTRILIFGFYKTAPNVFSNQVIIGPSRNLRSTVLIGNI